MKFLDDIFALLRKSAVDLMEKELLEREILFLLSLYGPLFGLPVSGWSFGLKHAKKMREEVKMLKRHFSQQGQDDILGEILGIFKIG